MSNKFVCLKINFTFRQIFEVNMRIKPQYINCKIMYLIFTPVRHIYLAFNILNNTKPYAYTFVLYSTLNAKKIGRTRL